VEDNGDYPLSFLFHHSFLSKHYSGDHFVSFLKFAPANMLDFNFPPNVFSDLGIVG
jgi:hypothetical protein